MGRHRNNRIRSGERERVVHLCLRETVEMHHHLDGLVIPENNCIISIPGFRPCGTIRSIIDENRSGRHLILRDVCGCELTSAHDLHIAIPCALVEDGEITIHEGSEPLREITAFSAAAAAAGGESQRPCEAGAQHQKELLFHKNEVDVCLTQLADIVAE